MDMQQLLFSMDTQRLYGCWGRAHLIGRVWRAIRGLNCASAGGSMPTKQPHTVTCSDKLKDCSEGVTDSSDTVRDREAVHNQQSENGDTARASSREGQRDSKKLQEHSEACPPSSGCLSYLRDAGIPPRVLGVRHAGLSHQPHPRFLPPACAHQRTASLQHQRAAQLRRMLCDLLSAHLRACPVWIGAN